MALTEVLEEEKPQPLPYVRRSFTCPKALWDKYVKWRAVQMTHHNKTVNLSDKIQGLIESLVESGPGEGGLDYSE